VDAMNKSLENLALRKQLLRARSTLCRLKIRHELNAVLDSLSWARAGATAVKALPVRSAVLGLALYGVSHSRLARLLTLAARTLLLARLASIAASMLRKPSALSPSVRERTDGVVIDL
jgi:hypothetical protein